MVKVVDFGIAKLRESSSHTQTGMVLGTPAYMSYEQASGMRSEELDARSDVYSLGVVAYEMLSGRVPFHSDTPVGYLRKHLMDQPPPFRAIAPGLGVPPAIEGAVLKALAKDRDQRYASVLDFARAFMPATPPAAVAVDSHPLPSTKVVAPPARMPEDREPRPQTHDGETIAATNRPPALPHVSQPRGVKKVLRRVTYVVSGLILLAIIAEAISIFYPHVHVRVRTTPHAAVFLDDSSKGTTDWFGQFSMDVTAGSHDLWITAPGKKDYRHKITVPTGQDLEINAPLENAGPPPPVQSGANEADMLERVDTARTQGDHYSDNGAYNDAINAYREGLKLDPSNLQLLQGLRRAQTAKAAEEKINH
jgi:serine/threonine protein kinase